MLRGSQPVAGSTIVFDQRLGVDARAPAERFGDAMMQISQRLGWDEAQHDLPDAVVITFERPLSTHQGLAQQVLAAEPVDGAAAAIPRDRHRRLLIERPAGYGNDLEQGPKRGWERDEAALEHGTDIDGSVCVAGPFAPVVVCELHHKERQPSGLLEDLPHDVGIAVARHESEIGHEGFDVALGERRQCQVHIGGRQTVWIGPTEHRKHVAA